MKKTISTQISGMQFFVDEDAYEKLENYLASIREHFRGSADRDEIVSDIERRIAEEFSAKLKKSKQVVSMEDVQSLIRSMGTIEDFEAFEEDEVKTATHEKKDDDTDEEEEDEPSWRKWSRSRRLFRDPGHKVLAGVCSGLAAYIAVDPVFVRIAFFLLFVITHGFAVLLYIVLWIAMPKARSLSEKVEMSGQAVTLSSLQEGLARDTREYNLKDFHGVAAHGAMRVSIRQGAHYHVGARGAKRSLRHVDFHVENGILHLGRERGHWGRYLFYGLDSLSVEITMPSLNKLTVKGASKVTVEGFNEKDAEMDVSGASELHADINAVSLVTSISGASSAEFSGSTDSLDLSMSGASNLKAKDFSAKTATVKISGACNVKLDVSESVEGMVSGASALKNSGGGTMNVRATGGSSATGGSKGKEKQDDDHDDTPHGHPHAKKHHGWHQMRNTGPTAARAVYYGGRSLLLSILEIIGTLVCTIGGIAVFFLFVGAAVASKTGSLPFLDFTGFAPFGTPMFYGSIAAAFIICLIPLIIVLSIGGWLLQLRPPEQQAGGLGGLLGVAAWIFVIVLGVNMLSDLRWGILPQSEATAKTYDLKGFDAVKTDGFDDVHVAQGATFSVTARGTDRAIADLDPRVEDGTLVFENAHQNGFCLFCRVARTEIDVVMPDVNTLSSGGLSRVTVTNLKSDAIDVITGGLSHVSLAGSGNALTLYTGGISRFDGSSFDAKTVSVTLGGISKATVIASDSISGSASGFSKLILHGKPAADTVTRDQFARIRTE